LQCQCLDSVASTSCSIPSEHTITAERLSPRTIGISGAMFNLKWNFLHRGQTTTM
jgi:hypothetical protein